MWDFLGEEGGSSQEIDCPTCSGVGVSGLGSQCEDCGGTGSAYVDDEGGLDYD